MVTTKEFAVVVAMEKLMDSVIDQRDLRSDKNRKGADELQDELDTRRHGLLEAFRQLLEPDDDTPSG